MRNLRASLPALPSLPNPTAAIAILVTLLVTPHVATHAASITGLGSLSGAGLGSAAAGVSADGSVVAGNSGHIFRWTREGGMVNLGDDIFTGQVYAVSADGSAIVGHGSFAGGMTGFRWTSEGGIVSLGLPDGYDYSIAFGVSGDGAVVVGGHYSDENGYVPFRWSESEGLAGLGTLPGGSTRGSASAASADGSIIVGAIDGGEGSAQAFRWTQAEGMVSLGELQGDHEWVGDSSAHDVSADGSVIVGTILSDVGTQSFRWTAVEGMVGLGNFRADSMCWGGPLVSADGKVVLSVFGGDNTIDASTMCGRRHGVYLWTQTGGWQSLWDLLLARGVDPQSQGWTELTAPGGISGDGRFVVGTGIRNGRDESFLADLQGSGEDHPVTGNLEIPADGSDQAGVGIVSGWHCTASVIEVQFDDLSPITTGSRTTRADTAGVCGDSENGFSLLWAYSLLGEGQHTAVLYADGVEFARSTFNVTLVNGEEFIEGASGAWELPNFPVPGHRLKVKWNEASQNLVIFGSEPMP